jgi:hypothetical protein
MSQWVKATSKVVEDVDMNILETAFAKMKLKMDNSVKSISNSWGKDEVDCGIRDTSNNDRLLDIGMKFNTRSGMTSMEVRGDFYFTKFRDQQQFIDQLSQNYQVANVEDKAMLNGYELESQEVLENGSVEMVLFAY